MSSSAALRSKGLDLEYPLSLGVYEQYSQAQRVVDHLSDSGFPVEKTEIVGTGLKTVERVTGRLTRQRVAVAGALSGLWIGLFVGIAFSIFGGQNQLGFLLTTPLLGAVFGLVWSQLGFRAATQGGARDFASINRTVATQYEVRVEHNRAAEARELIARMPA